MSEELKLVLILLSVGVLALVIAGVSVQVIEWLAKRHSDE